MQREKVIVLFTVLVDVIGFGIVIPILPFYVSSFGASPFVVTMLFSTYALFSFVSSPFLGALSDRVGRRPVLLASISSTAIGWFVFAAANSIPLLFLGRIIDGTMAGNFTVAQSCLVDVARNEKERGANLGLIGAAFGIGFLIGPVLGGLLSTVSHAFPFWVAGILATVKSILAHMFLPETHKHRDRQAALSFNPLTPLARAATNAELRPLFLRWATFAFAFSASQSVFALFTQNVLNFSAFTTGMLFTVIGLVTIVNQGVLLKQFWLKKYAEGRLEQISFIGLTIGLAFMSSRWEWLFLAALPLLAVSQSLLRVVITSQVAGSVGPQRKGEVLGILSSLMSATMVISPMLAGALFEVYESIPYALAAFLVAGAAVNAVRTAQATVPSPTTPAIEP
jgi:DHA1 family tetracycline resistance protein-like MFS transporter